MFGGCALSMPSSVATLVLKPLSNATRSSLSASASAGFHVVSSVKARANVRGGGGGARCSSHAETSTPYVASNARPFGPVDSDPACLVKI